MPPFAAFQPLLDEFNVACCDGINADKAFLGHYRSAYSASRIGGNVLVRDFIRQNFFLSSHTSETPTVGHVYFSMYFAAIGLLAVNTEYYRK